VVESPKANGPDLAAHCSLSVSRDSPRLGDLVEVTISVIRIADPGTSRIR